jgi:acyl-CoA thioester hydrolase
LVLPAKEANLKPSKGGKQRARLLLFLPKKNNMIEHKTKVRVRYSETDQMGYVYYGKFAEYFEIGRAELIRAMGISYKEVEARGILMPVSSFEIRYHQPVYYDELLQIVTLVSELPSSRFTTECKVYNEKGALAVSGKVVLAFIDKSRMRPVRAPSFILDAAKMNWGREL